VFFFNFSPIAEIAWLLKRLLILCIEHSDFEMALRIVKSSAKREGFETVPDVT
jgi:hypothetical protein